MRFKIAMGLLGLAAALYFFTAPTRIPPGPPSPPLEIDLSSGFQGPRAADDAALLSEMAAAVAENIEWDGKQPEPLLKTAHSLDQLRTRTREFLCKGESIGERNPKVRQIVGDYLESKLGTSGGAITPEQRASWVSAYREVSRAASYAIAH
jgi:hypothetical protein